jgi:RNA polymerase sigma-70 factor, ECF subfamily
MNQNACHDKTDEEIIQLSLHESEYFGCIIDRYEQKLKRYLTRIYTRDSEELSDTLQEAFIKIYENIHGFDSGLKFSSWAYRITHNLAVNKLRKKKNDCIINLSTEDAESLLSVVESDEDVKKTVIDNETERDIEKILEKLDEKYKNVLILKYLEEKDYTEISDIMKIPMGTVATYINRAKGKFKEEAKKSGFEF